MSYQEGDWQSLCEQETALLDRVETACEALLAACFEHYSSLMESAPTGIADNGVIPPEQPAPALLPAVELSG